MTAISVEENKEMVSMGIGEWLWSRDWKWLHQKKSG